MTEFLSKLSLLKAELSGELNHATVYVHLLAIKRSDCFPFFILRKSSKFICWLMSSGQQHWNTSHIHHKRPKNKNVKQKHKYNYIFRYVKKKTSHEITIFRGILQNHPLIPSQGTYSSQRLSIHCLRMFGNEKDEWSKGKLSCLCASGY